MSIQKSEIITAAVAVPEKGKSRSVLSKGILAAVRVSAGGLSRVRPENRQFIPSARTFFVDVATTTTGELLLHSPPRSRRTSNSLCFSRSIWLRVCTLRARLGGQREDGAGYA